MPNSGAKRESIDSSIRGAGIGCVDRKKALSDALIEYLAPITERINYYREHQDEVRDVIIEGSKRAREEAAQVMDEVRHAVKIDW